MFIYPLVLIMYGEHGGATGPQIGIIAAVGYVCLVLFEIPTGIFADKVARKYAVLTGLFMRSCSFFLWIVVPSFVGYVVAAVVFALGLALESGSWQAYLYVALPDDEKNNFGQYWSKVNASVMISYTSA